MYSPGGKTGKASGAFYGRLCKRESVRLMEKCTGHYRRDWASLRRFAHYDYWDNEVKPSILIESGADILVYGMGERPIIEIAEALDGGLAAQDITYGEKGYLIFSHLHSNGSMNIWNCLPFDRCVRIEKSLRTGVYDGDEKP